MKLFQKNFPALLFLVAASCPINIDQNAEPVPDIPATEFVQNMGIGINIGNSLDSIGNATWTAGETGWGNPKITQGFIKALKKYGYTTIRLPVTWAENIGKAPDFQIEPVWMNRVEEVVNWILDEDMYCILNLHHDGGESDRSWILNAGRDPEAATKQFAAVWKQIASRFKNASGKLVLESMNEVGFNNLWNQWDPATAGGKAQAYGIFNQLNQTFVDTVRATGSNNAARFLLISGYWTDIDQTCDPLFQIPRDTIEDRLTLSLHYYTPATFCILESDASWGKNQTDWGSQADYDELAAQFAKLKNRFIDNDIPIILGEYGVSFNVTKVEAARTRWITAVSLACLDNGICPVMWDTGNDIKRAPPYRMSGALSSAMAEIESSIK